MAGVTRARYLLYPDGTSRSLDPEQIRFAPLERAAVAGREIPVRWRVVLEELDRELVVQALHSQQSMQVDFAYWEGYVTASGTSPGESGRGYLEMVGYPLLSP